MESKTIHASLAASPAKPWLWFWQADEVRDFMNSPTGEPNRLYLSVVNFASSIFRYQTVLIRAYAELVYLHNIKRTH